MIKRKVRENNNVTPLPRNIHSEIKQAQIKFMNSSWDQEPRDILRGMAQIIELNAVYLQESPTDIDASIKSLISLAGFISAWAK